MSVAETLTLPNQPATGIVHRIPLGGNGFNAPHAAYVVDNFALVGDAGGGNINQTINMDERFCSLVAFVNIALSQATPADAGWHIALDSNVALGPVAPQTENLALTAIANDISTVHISHVWVPVPYVLPGAGGGGSISSQVLNNLNDTMRLTALIYLFDVNVRQVTPMGPLLWARGAT